MLPYSVYLRFGSRCQSSWKQPAKDFYHFSKPKLKNNKWVNLGSWFRSRDSFDQGTMLQDCYITSLFYQVVLAYSYASSNALLCRNWCLQLEQELEYLYSSCTLLNIFLVQINVKFKWEVKQLYSLRKLFSRIMLRLSQWRFLIINVLMLTSWGSLPFIHTSIVRVGQHRCVCVDRTWYET